MLTIPKQDFVLLETNRTDSSNKTSYLFRGPREIIACYRLRDVEKTLLEIEKWIARGYYAAGFLSYEAGYAFEAGFGRRSSCRGPVPLLWFGIYKKPIIIKGETNLNWGPKGAFRITGARPNVSYPRYRSAVEAIKNRIRRGETYQVNYTFKYKFGFKGSEEALYSALKASQKTSYAALIKTPGFSVISASPELFFRMNGAAIETKPMKGTAERGRFAEEDNSIARGLGDCRKNRAENVMIVDLLRNDLSKVCAVSSVRTEKMFEVEKYGTLFQMVSTVKGKLENTEFAGIIRNLYPSGSITGAPKINTMRIIRSLEKESRGVYTGAIGYISPRKKAVFNVAIRTVVVERGKGRGEMGVGSGITIDSTPASEYAESCLKAKFALERPRDFKLFETMLLRKGKKIRLLKYHMERMKSSAGYFGFTFNGRQARKVLQGAIRRAQPGKDARLRLLLSAGGVFEAEILGLEKTGSRLVKFSKHITDSKDRFLFHKTTNRELYRQELEDCRKKGFYDVIFTNELGQVTESAASNILILKNGLLYTPTKRCGLLAGTYLKHLMNTKYGKIKEKLLYRKDILNADKLYLANSVRGLVEVKLAKAHDKN